MFFIFNKSIIILSVYKCLKKKYKDFSKNLMFLSKNLIRVLRFPLKNNKPDLLLSLISIIFAAALQMSIPYYLGSSIDTALNNNETGNLSLRPFITIGILVLVLSIARGIFSFFHVYQGEKMGQSVAFNLRKEYFNKLQRLSFNYHDNVHTGDLITKGIIDIEGCRMFINTGILRIVFLSVFISTGAILVLNVDLFLGLLALSFVPVIGIISSYARLTLRKEWYRLQEQLGILTRVMDENLSGVRLVRSFMKQKYELEKYSIASQVVKSMTFRQISIRSFSISLNSFAFLISMSLVVYFGSIAVLENKITLGELTSLIAFMSILQGPVRQIGMLVNSFARASATSARLFEVIDKEEDVKNIEGKSFNEPVRKIKVENLSFSYGTTKVLKDINFEATPNHSIGIVGPPGSGKTTLSRLLPRFYNPTEGSIKLNDINISTFDLKDLRHSVNLVDQDNFLFSDTFFENVRYGDPAAPKEKVNWSTDKAQIYNHIDTLPGKFDTLIGERGVQLSGGQRQRLSVSRTLLFESKVVIFDDSTSAIDTQTEKKIREEMMSLGTGITLIVIAHRISSVMNLDEILYLDSGEIVERGNHNELIKLNGRYSELYNMQINPELKV
ncbi:MAG: multidrug ABC transporter [Dehalococcoidia bacterium]|nr:multidrug ABC transporter [Dehalococcoidia bacterium]